jgi:LuxR family maltose regulon positive regulatory protein
MLDAAGTAADLERDPTSPWYAVARMDLGYARYLAGDLEAAVPPLEDAVHNQAATPIIRIAVLSLLSLVAGEFGRDGQAAELARAARGMVDEHGLTESPQVCIAYTANGAALARRQRYREAIGELEHALRVRRRVPGMSPWPALGGLNHLAEVMADLGDHARCGALLAEASSLLEAIPGGGGHLQVRLSSVRRRLNGSAARSAPVERLTEREEAVLRLLRGDLSLREIAEELFVSANTVKTHAHAVYRKLGASSRAEAVRKARELGLL